MKYEKASVEVLSFEENELFMIASGDVAAAIDAAKARWGLLILNCGSVTYSNNVLACTNVEYQRQPTDPYHKDAYQTWTVK